MTHPLSSPPPHDGGGGISIFEIDFEPIGRRGLCSSEQSLLDCARQVNVDIVSICGGSGSCERCKVQIITGELTPITDEEKATLTKDEEKQGYRLACRAYPLSDVKVHVPPESLTAPQRTQVEGLEVNVQPEPPVCGYDTELKSSTLDAPQADDAAVWEALASIHGIPAGTMDFQVSQELSGQIRAQDWQINAVLRGSEIIALGLVSTRWLGLAVDIGTTKIAGYLLDLESGTTLAAQGLMNPQIAYGEDVIARIVAATQSPADAAKLQSLLVDALNQLANELCTRVEATTRQIAEAVVVGNTAIHHLFLRLPVKQLGLSPYVPAIRSAVDIKARDLGLNLAPGAYVHLLPNIAGYVGADHVAMLLATQIALQEHTVLAIDIGTNTEICLQHQGRMTSVSCASGPAFEGAHIKFGMRAAPGAIEYARLHEDKLELQTIGRVAPVGICGSGLLDIVAQLRINGVIDRRGRMGEHPRMRVGEQGREFILAGEGDPQGSRAITLSQKDVRELQLAKAAVRLGIQALVEAYGLAENDLEQVIVAGAFGTFINISSAITIGMLPNLPLDRYQQVGNAAGTGARLALISLSQREEARRLAEKVEYIELANLSGFQKKFSEATYLEAG